MNLVYRLNPSNVCDSNQNFNKNVTALQKIFSCVRKSVNPSKTKLKYYFCTLGNNDQDDTFSTLAFSYGLRFMRSRFLPTLVCLLFTLKGWKNGHVSLKNAYR